MKHLSVHHILPFPTPLLPPPLIPSSPLCRNHLPASLHAHSWSDSSSCASISQSWYDFLCSYGGCVIKHTHTQYAYSHNTHSHNTHNAHTTHTHTHTTHTHNTHTLTHTTHIQHTHTHTTHSLTHTQVVSTVVITYIVEAVTFKILLSQEERSKLKVCQRQHPKGCTCSEGMVVLVHLLMTTPCHQKMCCE